MKQKECSFLIKYKTDRKQYPPSLKYLQQVTSFLNV